LEIAKMAERVLDPELRKKLTFKQAEGLEAVPGPLQFLELDRDFRLRLWDVMFAFLQAHCRQQAYGSTTLIAEGHAWVAQVNRYVRSRPLDEAISLEVDYDSAVAAMRALALNGKLIDILETVQVTLRMQGVPDSFKRGLVRIITSERTSYSVIDDTIIPLGSPEERDSVASNLAEVASSPLSGAYAHLKKAGTDLTAGNSRDAIRESIHAVESATIHVTGNKKATLGDALAQIQKSSPIHSTMKAAFEKLCAYTNAERGIRHALLDSENEKVGREEALFMFSACTAFVAYLVRKNLSRATVANPRA
jgi:hypothetical protein